jgi:16S rRNA processing protein RimM
MKLQGIDSPEAAKSLSGAELIVQREQAAPLEEGEFYVEDLRSLEVVYAGRTIGHITGVIEAGGGSLIEIRLASGETKLIPFRDEFLGDVDIEAKRAVLLQDWILA